MRLEDPQHLTENKFSINGTTNNVLNEKLRYRGEEDVKYNAPPITTIRSGKWAAVDQRPGYRMVGIDQNNNTVQQHDRCSESRMSNGTEYVVVDVEEGDGIDEEISNDDESNVISEDEDDFDDESVSVIADARRRAVDDRRARREPDGSESVIPGYVMYPPPQVTQHLLRPSAAGRDISGSDRHKLSVLDERMTSQHEKRMRDVDDGRDVMNHVGKPSKVFNSQNHNGGNLFINDGIRKQQHPYVNGRQQQPKKGQHTTEQVVRSTANGTTIIEDYDANNSSSNENSTYPYHAHGRHYPSSGGRRPPTTTTHRVGMGSATINGCTKGTAGDHHQQQLLLTTTTPEESDESTDHRGGRYLLKCEHSERKQLAKNSTCYNHNQSQYFNDNNNRTVETSQQGSQSHPSRATRNTPKAQKRRRSQIRNNKSSSSVLSSNKGGPPSVCSSLGGSTSGVASVGRTTTMLGNGISTRGIIPPHRHHSNHSSSNNNFVPVDLYHPSGFQMVCHANSATSTPHLLRPAYSTTSVLSHLGVSNTDTVDGEPCPVHHKKSGPPSIISAANTVTGVSHHHPQHLSHHHGRGVRHVKHKLIHGGVKRAHSLADVSMLQNCGVSNVSSLHHHQATTLLPQYPQSRHLIQHATSLHHIPPATTTKSLPGLPKKLFIPPPTPLAYRGRQASLGTLSRAAHPTPAYHLAHPTSISAAAAAANGTPMLYRPVAMRRTPSNKKPPIVKHHPSIRSTNTMRHLLFQPNTLLTSKTGVEDRHLIQASSCSTNSPDLSTSTSMDPPSHFRLVDCCSGHFAILWIIFGIITFGILLAVILKFTVV